MVVEVERIVRERRRAVHRAAVRDHDEDLACLRPRREPRARPFDRFAVHTFAEQIRLEQRGNARARMPPAGIRVLEHQVAGFVEPARMTRLAAREPLLPGAAAVPGERREAQHFGCETGGIARAGQRVDHQRDTVDPRLHRPGAVDQERERAVGMRPHAFEPKQPPFGRRADELREPAAVEAALLLTERPAVGLRHDERRAQHAG